MIESVAKAKLLIREVITRKREAIGNIKRDEISLSIARRLFELDEFKKSKSVLCFLSLPNEIQTDLIIRESFRLAKKVFVPLINDRQDELQVACIPSLDIEFISGKYDVREPTLKAKEVVPLSCIDFVITPGLAFDIYGNRIGYGGGYYDKLFKKLPKNVSRVGVGYDFQILDFVPHSEFDEPVQYVVTENNTLKIPRLRRY